ncbi:hypothetical protein ABEI22_23610 [Erwinia billingiae]|uniref:hypothetical protein n=1 Tax=Erwinia billingiae TaxID=182337 RepID=UPI003208F9E5
MQTMLSAIRKRLSAVPPARRKSWGEWCMLGSALFIVPLLVFHNLSTGVKAALQLLWVIILAAGFWLAGSVKKR